MNSSAEPKMPDSFQQLPVATSLLKAGKELGHPCSGEERCCGGCRNPQWPLASQVDQTSTHSESPSEAEPSPESDHVI